MNKAMNKDLVIATVAGNGNLVGVNLATDETTWSIYFHHRQQVTDNFKNRKERIEILLLGDMVTVLITAS